MREAESPTVPSLDTNSAEHTSAGSGMPLVANTTETSGKNTSDSSQPTKETRAKRRPSSSQVHIAPLQDLQLGQSRRRNTAWPEAYHNNSSSPWTQHHRSGPLQGAYPPLPMQRTEGSQHHMQPYWIPYMSSMYQMYGDQRATMFPQGAYPGMMPYPQMVYPGLREMMNNQAGSQYAHTARGRPYMTSVQLQPVRGRPPRSTKIPLEAPETYDFSMEEATASPETARKTLMLRNIPNKYSIHMLLEMLNQCHGRSAGELVYDFCYLPIDFKNRCNLGYAFVNFTDTESTIDCYKAFHNKRWNDFNSKKVCEVKYARVQGQEALVDHFRNSKFPVNDVDSLPLLFEKATQANGEQVIRSLPLHSRQTS